MITYRREHFTHRSNGKWAGGRGDLSPQLPFSPLPSAPDCGLRPTYSKPQGHQWRISLSGPEDSCLLPFCGLLLLSYDNFLFLFSLPLSTTKALAWALRPYNETPGLVLRHLPPLPPPPYRLTDGRRQNVRSVFIFLGAGERHRLPQLPRFFLWVLSYYVRLALLAVPMTSFQGPSLSALMR